MRAAVFLDRDGVINRNRDDYVRSWKEFVFLPNVFKPLRLLAQSHLMIIVVTNQSAINRGLVEPDVVKDINARMVDEICREGGRVDAVFVCPHRPDEGCDCRKPRPGLLFQAAERFNLDLSRSYLIGDALSDVRAALAAGVQPVLILTGRGPEEAPLLHQRGYDCIPVARSLAEAEAFILGEQSLGRARE